MNDLPRQTLSRIIAEHGRGICDAPKRVEALLKDLCGAHRREINIIVGALEERVVADLIAAGSSVPREVLLARLAARLRDNLAYTPEAARWGVDTWAVALGIATEAELLERAWTKPAEASRSSSAPPPPPVRDPTPSAPNPAGVSKHPPPPQRGTTSAPQPQAPKTNPPPIIRPPAPRAAPARPPNVFARGPRRQNIPTAPQPRQTSGRGLKLRGCLILVVLIIVLVVAAIVIVPAVIHVLQEEQARPSINEPRIR
jgi:hypothetical protein